MLYQSASVGTETQHCCGLGHWDPARKAVNALPSRDMQKFRGQLKNPLSRRSADVRPCHLMPSPRSLRVSAVTTENPYIPNGKPEQGGSNGASSSTESASKSSSKLQDQDQESKWEK